MASNCTTPWKDWMRWKQQSAFSTAVRVGRYDEPFFSQGDPLLFFGRDTAIAFNSPFDFIEAVCIDENSIDWKAAALSTFTWADGEINCD